MNEFIEWSTLDFKKSSGTEKLRCPKCDSVRSDKKDKSLVVYHKDGICKCFYCNALSFRDSQKNERETKVNYTLPSQEWRNYTKLSDKLVKWFENRGIKQYVLNDFCISEEVMYQPQLKKPVNNVVFNYFEGELLVNKKYRSGDKKFTQSKNGKPILYNINSVIGCEEVYICEGECFKGSTEVLTNKGWVSFDNYKGEDICQVDEFKKYSFVKPLNIIKKKYNDDLVKLSNSKNFEITTTKNHNIVLEDKKGVLSKVKAIDIFSGKSNHKKIPRVCNGTNKEDYNISDNDLRLQVMFSADFTFRKEGDLYAGFKKERKVERVKMLLDKSEFEYSCNKVKNGYTSVFISRKFNTKRFSKLFNNEWLSLLSERQLKVVLDEIVHWDGNSVPNRNQIEYSSKEYHNVTFVQTVAHLLGYMSTIIPRSNKFGSWYKASILFSKKHTSLQLSTKKELEKYNDFVYCVSVPTGMILVRQNNQISICGNCDVLSLAQIGIKNSVSLPTGANDNDAFWINSEKYLKDVKKFYIATDNDEKGNEVAEKIAQRLGRYRCERVLFNGKDANEDLVSGCLEETILNTEKYPVSGTYSVDDVWGDVLDLLKNGIPETIKPKGEWCKGLNDIFSVMRGHLIVSTGIPSHGKSNFTDWYVLNLIQDYGMKASWFSPEHNPMSLYVTNLGTKALGTNLFKATDQQRNEFKEWATEKIYLTNADSGQEPNWEWLLDTFQNQMMRYGIDIFVIDAWNKVILNDKNELQGIRRVLTKLTAFAQQNNVMIFLVAHPTKMKKNEKTKEYEQPTLYDVAGSADFRNQTHDGFCVYRYFNEGKTTITNLKTKMSFQGEIGKSADFYYNIENGRYFDCSTQKNNLPLWHDSKPTENKYYNTNTLPTPSYQEAFDLNINDDDYCPF